MIKVKLSILKNFPILRQTPNSSGIWGECEFFINQEVKECDYWVVYEGIDEVERVKCNSNFVILITGEPPSVKTYKKQFLKQFHAVITCHQKVHPNIINTQQALPWMVGIKFIDEMKKWDYKNFKNYNDLLNLNCSNKPKLLSIITSNKEITAGHGQRVKFVNRLIEVFGYEIDVFGRGFKNIPDKIEALYNYKYTIVIENSSYTDYWSEKLADAFLMETYPIYYGCPNIFDYFPKGSLSLININNIDESISIIKEILNSNQYEQSIRLIRQSRELVLNQYNIFALISKIIGDFEKSKNFLKSPKHIKIFTEKTIWMKIRDLIYSIKYKLFMSQICY